MASPPQLKRLVVEDFPADAQKWIGKLVEPLNVFMEEVNAAFSQQIKIVDNFAGSIKTITAVVTGGSYVAQKIAYPRRPRAIIVGDIKGTDNLAPTLTAAVSVLWDYTQTGAIQIKNLAGLTNGSYFVTLVILEG